MYKDEKKYQRQRKNCFKEWRLVVGAAEWWEAAAIYYYSTYKDIAIFGPDKTQKLNTCCEIQDLVIRRAYENNKIFPATKK